MHRVRTGIAAGLGITVLAGLVWIGFALADDPKPAISAEAKAIAAAVAAGRHTRIDGPHGPIHVWVPAGYHADTGATVIYVHGYFDDADTAWVGHQLPEQFAMSAKNAMFIVPEAPVARGTPVNYPDLTELIRLVEDRTGVTRGAALTAAVGHSGAYRTIQAWMNEPLLDHITWIDAMYGEEEIIGAWLRASPRRKLITVGEDTILGTESFAARVAADTVTIDRVPPGYDLWPAAARTAKHLYVRAQWMHMPLVLDAIVIPALMRLLPIEPLADLPWKLPQGVLPPLPDAATD
ncbi:MAG: hypothetical protein ABI867_02590 [Kofleriaceae bacterium]